MRCLRLTIYELECFVALANYLNFTKAAEFMNVTQPAFSRHILFMENELNVSLFFRNKRSVYLTAAGEAFLVEAKNILEHYHNGLAKALQAEKGQVGSIKIGILSEQFNELISKSIKMFTESYPSIEVEINEYTSSSMISALKKYEIDIGFTISPGISAIDDIIWKSNMVLEQAVALPWNHHLADRDSIDVKELEDEMFIFLDSENFAIVNDVALQICMANHFNPRVAKRATSISGLLTLVECGKGISIIPYHFKNQFSHKVHIIKLSKHCCTVERIFAWRKNNTNPCLPLFISKLNIDSPDSY